MTRRASQKRRPQAKTAAPRTVVHRTAWHPLLAEVLTRILPPSRGYEVLSEVQLSYQPLRADYVILRKEPRAQPASQMMAPLTRHLGPYNVIELTGPTSALQADDVRWTRIYVDAVCIKLGIDDHREVHVFVVASRLTDEFRRRAAQYRGTFHLLEPGVHELRGLDHVTYCIETETAGDHILRLLSPHFLKDSAGLFSLLSEEEKAIFWMVYDRIEQFKKDPQTAQQYPDWKDIVMTTQEFMDKFLARLSPEQRIKGIPPEELLKGIPSKQRLAGIPLEERLGDLSNEQREQLLKLLLKR